MAALTMSLFATAFQMAPHGSMPAVMLRGTPTMVPAMPAFPAAVAAPRVAKASSPKMIGLPTFAAGANLASFGLYGLALVLKPGWLMKNVMMSDDDGAPWKLNTIPCAICQYLGAVYLAQALRMVRALTWMPHMLKTDLLGVGFIQLFLCIVSLGRLAAGIDKNEVTMTLPLGQGIMAALALIGGSRL